MSVHTHDHDPFCLAAGSGLLTSTSCVELRIALACHSAMTQTADDIVQAVPAEHRRHAARMIEACQIAVAGGFQPGTITGLIGIAGDYGPWLENVRQAIASAVLSEVDRIAMQAAFNMATVILSVSTDARRLRAHDRDLAFQWAAARQDGG